MNMIRTSRQALLSLAGLLLLSSCATEGMLPHKLEVPRSQPQDATAEKPGTEAGRVLTTSTTLPPLPAPDRDQTGKPPAPVPLLDAEKADITLAFEQIPLPGFIQAVYGVILKRNVNLDQKVTERQDLVTLRSGSPQTASQVEEAARMLLKSYGITVVDVGGLVRFVPDSAQLGYLPEIRRGRALPTTPQPLRPVFQLVELHAVRNTDIASWINTLYSGRIKMTEDATRNAIMLSGNSDDVRAAMEAIQLLDQPMMSGSQSVRINPAYWSVEEMAKKLMDILNAEGYRVGVGSSGGIMNAATLLPISAVNAVFFFARDQRLIEHVIAWARELDKPSNTTGRTFFSYPVKYNDATRLAATLEKVLTSNAPDAATAGKTATPKLSKVVVDTGSNTIIYQGNSEDYGQVRSLLEALDKPAKEALIEVTVAEVTLSDNTQFGIEWLAKEAGLSNGDTAKYGTLGGLSVGSGGLTYKRFDSAGDLKLVLNALASNNRATVLSSPRVVARNGEQATIQVGQEVPIITSQQTTAATGGTGILQSVQYRNTGVILTVKPVIHSGDQVELDVSQEVSAAQTTNTGVTSSPTFGTRRIQTKLSLKNGSTVMLGGLISNNQSGGNAGIPLLKDIPGLGQLFRTDTKADSRTELIIIITPYILSSDEDAVAVTEAFKKQLGPWAQPRPMHNAPLGAPKLPNETP